MNSAGMSEDKKRNEIETNLSYNMFVEAGAGAGKTTPDRKTYREHAEKRL